MTAEVDADQLRDAVERLHGSRAQLVRAVPLVEAFGGRPAWYGVVQIFDLGGHRSADRCYAWSSRIEGSDRRRVFAVLQTPSIASPADAVHAAVLRRRPRLMGRAVKSARCPISTIFESTRCGGSIRSNRSRYWTAMQLRCAIT